MEIRTAGGTAGPVRGGGRMETVMSQVETLVLSGLSQGSQLT